MVFGSAQAERATLVSGAKGTRQGQRTQPAVPGARSGHYIWEPSRVSHQWPMARRGTTGERKRPLVALLGGPHAWAPAIFRSETTLGPGTGGRSGWLR